MHDSAQISVNRRRGLIPEDLLNFRWLAELAIAPDGSQIAYTIRRPHAPSNGYISHLYLHDLRTDTASRLTFGDCQVSSIAWSRDSSRIAYTHSDDDGDSVRVLEVNEDFESVFATDGMLMTSLDWSADGTKLVGVRWTPMRSADERGPVAGIPKPTVKVVRRLRYKQDGVGWVHDRFTQIWVLELETGDFVQVTHSECDYSSPTWSNHRERIAFVGMAREQNTSLGYGQILTCDYPTGESKLLLPDWQGTAFSPVWGADDKYIAFAGHNLPPPVNRRNFWQPHLADVAVGTAVKLGTDIDEEVGNYAVADQRVGLSNVSMKWAVGDEWIYYLLTEQGATNPLPYQHRWGIRAARQRRQRHLRIQSGSRWHSRLRSSRSLQPGRTLRLGQWRIAQVEQPQSLAPRPSTGDAGKLLVRRRRWRQSPRLVDEADQL